MTEQIAIAFINDIDVLCNLLNSLFSQDIEFEPDLNKQRNGLSTIIENPEIGHILVLKKESEVIGMVSLLYSISTALGGKVAVLEDMIIDENFRNVGYGTKLLTHAIEFAQKNQCLRITLLTDYNNNTAIEFYKKQGFVKSQMIPMRRIF